MKRVTKKNILEKNLFKKIFLLSIFLASQNILSTDNRAKQLPSDLFNNYILKYFFNKSTSIHELQKSYYRCSLISKSHNTATKNFWNENWFNIMKDVCDQHRFERLYFAGIFYHINDKIKEYFEKHLFVYKTLQYLSSNEVFIHPPNLEWFRTLDPNFTMFGPNCQMSLLEYCIKACYYPVKNKIELCIELIKSGAQYDIWMYRGINQGEEKALVDDINTIKAKSENPYGPFLLSEYIARHIRCNEELAKEIIQKGTCVQDIFIKRFPNLKIYTKKQHIPKPPIPENFLNNHHFSEIRYL